MFYRHLQSSKSSAGLRLSGLQVFRIVMLGRHGSLSDTPGKNRISEGRRSALVSRREKKEMLFLQNEAEKSLKTLDHPSKNAKNEAENDLKRTVGNTVTN
ncbi:MAG: hypothetical protein ACRD3T_05370 [Terriglobia bacterium]